MDTEKQITKHFSPCDLSGASLDADVEASTELFKNGVTDFSGGQMELYEAVEQAYGEDEILIKTLIERIVQDDLEAISDLKLAVRMAALIRNDDRIKYRYDA